MKIKKVISMVINVLLGAILIGIAFVVISSKVTGEEPSVFGYQLKTVLSGSMEPGIHTGSIIAVKPGGDTTRFKEGDVITFIRDSMSNDLVTHRVIEVIKEASEVQYVTKGDNNEDPDPSHVGTQNIVGEYTGFTIPYVGYFINFATSKEGSILLMGVPALLLLFYSFTTIKAAFREEKKKKDSDTTLNV